MLRKTLLILFLIFLPDIAQAQVSVEAEVSRNKISIDSSIKYSLTIRGAEGVAPVRLPQFEGFQHQYEGQSSQVRISNGQYESYITYSYRLYPSTTGKFLIPSFEMVIDGQTVQTNSIEVEVVDSVVSTIDTPNTGSTSFSDRLFITMRASKDEVYLNEELPIKVLLLINELDVRDINFPELEELGFVLKEFGQPDQYGQIIKGLRYNIVEFNTVVYPTRTGELSLGQATLDCSVLYQSDSQSSGLSGSLFDDDFFSGFFSRYEKRPMSLTSNEVTINVLPLPEEGRPKNFNNAVGQFNFTAKASPLILKEGDPITLKMSVTGEGNLSAVNFPEVKNGGQFKLYEPSISEIEGTKTLEQVLIPVNSSVKEIPVIEFSYFDTELKKYKTIKQGPFALTVERVEGGNNLKVVSSGVSNVSQPENLGEDIVYIKDNFGQFRKVGASIFKNAMLYGAIIVLFALWIFAFNSLQKTRRLATDTKFARKMQAPKFAKKGLARALEAKERDDAKDFYDAVFKTLQDYFSNTLHLPAGQITFLKVSESLSNTNIKQDSLSSLKQLFDSCDSIRYASVDVSAEKMNADYALLEELIDYLQRNKI